MNKKRSKKEVWTKDDEIIWNNVERLRKEKGWTYRKLAQMSKCYETHINKIKMRDRGVGVLMLNRLASAFEVPVSTLLNEKIDSFPTYSVSTNSILYHNILEDILTAGTDEQKTTIIDVLKGVSEGMMDRKMMDKMEIMNNKIEKLIDVVEGVAKEQVEMKKEQGEIKKEQGEIKKFGNAYITRSSVASALPVRERRSRKKH